MASTVPKFASFRPKPKADPEVTRASEEHEKVERRDRSGKSDRRDRSGRREQAEKSERSSKQDVFVAKRRSLVPEEKRDASYFVDRRGDPAISTYGSLNRYDTPAYRRYGYGSILGVSPHRRIDRESSSDKAICLSGSKQRRERLLTSKTAVKEGTRSLRLVKATTTSDGNEELDFIEFSVKKKRQRHADLEQPDSNYRSLERVSSAPAGFDSDFESESETEAEQPNAEVTRQNSTLTQRTRDHPSDLQAWLHLIHHQEAMMGLGRFSELKGVDLRHLADVRISTYEQAIKKIGNDKNSQIQLHLGLMDEAFKTWDQAKLTKKWAEVSAKYPGSPDVWMRYLDFLQSNFTGFKYELFCSACHQCLDALRSGSEPVLPETYLHIILRLTSVIRGAGYQELSLAIWQSLLEYHLLKPENAFHSRTEEEAVHVFEEFWDGEVARIGEVGAKGWRNFNEADDPPTILDTVSLREADQSLSVFDDFGARELDYMEKLRCPGRTTDEIGQDDPFHLVMFSDIERYLRLVPQDTPGTLILEAFLCFSLMPPSPTSDPDQRIWCSDPFLRRHSNSPCSNTCDTSSFAQSFGKFMNGPNDFQMATELLFDYGFPASLQMLDLKIIQRVLKLLVSHPTYGEAIGEYLLAFELNYFPSESFKTAKQLLKARPTSGRLYNAYGLVESRRGKTAKADQVFAAALSMQKDATPLATLSSVQLFHSWVWEALRTGADRQALWRLVSPQANAAKPADNLTEGPDHAALLRGRTVLSEAKGRALLSRDYCSAILCTSLLALLAYLSNGLKPEVALAVHDKLSVWFVDHGLSGGPAAEVHAQSIAHFLMYYATKSPIVKPAHLRDALEPLIARFPSNTILLSAYAANETRFSIDDRVRDIMHQRELAKSREKRLSQWLFAIHYEMQRSEIAGSTSHSVRALFKKAEDDVGAQCSDLWRCHVLFELSEVEKEWKKRPGKKHRKDGKKSKEEMRLEESIRRLKETFFRGITHLPWCKDYIMLAFTHLKEGVLTHEEFRKVYNVMVEKELRIYVDMNIDL